LELAVTFIVKLISLAARHFLYISPKSGKLVLIEFMTCVFVESCRGEEQVAREEPGESASAAVALAAVEAVAAAVSVSSARELSSFQRYLKGSSSSIGLKNRQSVVNVFISAIPNFLTNF
jgi:hypothetical protein